VVEAEPVNPDAALEAACRLVGELKGRTPLRASAGVAHGRVLAHAGDFLGPAVNLASRLAEIAQPDEVLVDAEAWPKALALGSPREVSPRGLRAGWRLLIYFGMIFILALGAQLLAKRLSSGQSKGAPLSEFVRTMIQAAGEFILFLLLVFLAWVMSKIEHRKPGDYGLPLRKSVFP